jgi:hypothetical protein
MSTTTTPDETPKQQIAKKVITPKRKYFLPEAGVEVEATSLENAVNAVTKQTNDVKAGDE